MRRRQTKAAVQSQQQINSTYQGIYSWLSFMLATISLGILIWQQSKNYLPLNEDNSRIYLLDDNNYHRSLSRIQFPNVMPFIACNFVAYQTNSMVIALTGCSLFLADAVAAQPLAPRVIVPEFMINSNVTGDQVRPGMANLSSGKWSIVWHDIRDNNHDIYAKEYASNGTILKPDFLVNSITAKDQHDPTALGLSSGDQWLVTWDTYLTTSADIFARRYSASGNALDNPEFQMNINTQSYNFKPALAELKSGEWVGTWVRDFNSTYNVYARRYQGSSAASSEFQVNTGSRSGISSIVATGLATGGWVAVWMGDYDIYASVYSASNSALSSEFLVNTNTTREQMHPTVGSFATGGWVAAWMGAQDQESGGNWNVYAQLFGSNNLPVGAEFVVSSNTTNSQQNPIIYVLSSSAWAITWESDHANDNDIYVKIYDVNGTALSGDYRVNLNKTGQQTNPAIVGLNNYDVVLSWMSGDSPASDHDIYATILSFEPTPAPTPQPTPNPAPNSTTPPASIVVTPTSSILSSTASPLSTTIPTTMVSSKSSQTSTQSSSTFFSLTSAPIVTPTSYILSSTASPPLSTTSTITVASKSSQMSAQSSSTVFSLSATPTETISTTMQSSPQGTAINTSPSNFGTTTVATDTRITTTSIIPAQTYFGSDQTNTKSTEKVNEPSNTNVVVGGIIAGIVAVGGLAGFAVYGLWRSKRPCRPLPQPDPPIPMQPRVGAYVPYDNPDDRSVSQAGLPPYIGAPNPYPNKPSW